MFSSPAAVTASREASAVSPAGHTAPTPQDIWPQALACPKAAIKALTHNLDQEQMVFSCRVPTVVPAQNQSSSPCTLLRQSRDPRSPANITASLGGTSPVPAWPAQPCSLAPAAAAPQQGSPDVLRSRIHSPALCPGQRPGSPPLPTQTKHASRTRMMEFSSGAVTCLARSMAPKTCC